MAQIKSAAKIYSQRFESASGSSTDPYTDRGEGQGHVAIRSLTLSSEFPKPAFRNAATRWYFMHMNFVFFLTRHIWGSLVICVSD